MSSLRIVSIPVKVPIRPEDGPRIDLVCNWEKHLHPSARPGYRVEVVTVPRGAVIASTSEVRDHEMLSAALRDCARRVQALEREGWE